MLVRAVLWGIAAITWQALGLPIALHSAAVSSSGEVRVLPPPHVDECMDVKLCLDKLGSASAVNLRNSKGKQLMCLEASDDSVRSGIAPECVPWEQCLTNAGQKENMRIFLRASGASLSTMNDGSEENLARWTPTCKNEDDPGSMKSSLWTACQQAIDWARSTGVAQSPEGYEGLTSTSSWVKFQAIIAKRNNAQGCVAPCFMCRTEQDPTWIPDMDQSPCQKAIYYAMNNGIVLYPDSYPGLNHSTSTSIDFQAHLAQSDDPQDCLEPCPTKSTPMFSKLLQSPSASCVDPSIEDLRTWQCNCLASMKTKCGGMDEKCFQCLMCESPHICDTWKDKQCSRDWKHNNCPSTLVTISSKGAMLMRGGRMDAESAAESVNGATQHRLDTGLEGTLAEKCGH